MKQNMRIKTVQEGGRQKEHFEHFHLQNDEFDPYAIVVLSQLWRSAKCATYLDGFKKILKKIQKNKRRKTINVILINLTNDLKKKKYSNFIYLYAVCNFYLNTKMQEIYISWMNELILYIYYFHSCTPAVSPEKEIKFFLNAILEANWWSARATKYVGMLCTKIKWKKVLEIEKSFLGQNGVEFQVKIIENIKMGKTMKLRTLCATYLISS